MSPSVQDAMDEERPTKATVRQLWLECMEEYVVGWDRSQAFYTTLSGKNALDVKAMINAGIIGTNEVGGIADTDVAMVYAVDSSALAISSVLRQIPGIRVINSGIEAMVSGTQDPTSFPSRKDRTAILARVVNLDYNTFFNLHHNAAGMLHPQLELIRKIAQMRGIPNSPTPWAVFLTLHGGVRWTQAAQAQAIAFLRENMESVPGFADDLANFVDVATLAWIESGGSEDFERASADAQQRLLCAFVPKRVAHLVAGHGWSVRTRANWRYGGSVGSAPMCTWVFEFDWNARFDANHRVPYEQSVAQLFDNAASVLDDGSVWAGS